MLFSKLSTKSSVGITTICGICGGIAAWQMIENEDDIQDENQNKSISETTIEEYLVEIKELITKSEKTAISQPLIENKGGDDKNYFCQWNKANSKTKKDEDCKLIKLDFGNDKKSLNLNQISEMNTEISANDIKDKKNLFKLKISSNYVFDLNHPIEIKIIDKNANNTIFTTLIPKFKISSPLIEGKTDSFLVKLSKTTSFNLNRTSSFSCKWITKDLSKQIAKDWRNFTRDNAKSVKICNIYKFDNQPKINKSKIVDLNLNDINKIENSQTLMLNITSKTLGNYFIINFSQNKDFQSISKILNTYDLVFVNYKNNQLSHPQAIFTIESPLAGQIKTPISDSNLILLS